jgi:hypothetical protein
MFTSSPWSSICVTGFVPFSLSCLSTLVISIQRMLAPDPAHPAE